MVYEDGEAVEQASDLWLGRVNGQTGLWIVCDRNGGRSAGRILCISGGMLDGKGGGTTLRVTDSFRVAPPREGWAEFRARHRRLAADVLDRLAAQVEASKTGKGQTLDLEGVTFGVGAGQRAFRLFVVAEQPDSLVLELVLSEDCGEARAFIAACYDYEEAGSERGGDSNDGLEGIAWAGRPGEFYVCEEGTARHADSNGMLFFLRPRLMRCRLEDGQVRVDREWSDRATSAVWSAQRGNTQTLNGLALVRGGSLLALDRNGAAVLDVDTERAVVRRRWDLCQEGGVNLREVLSEFPARRRMPYVSIEGIACDERGGYWLVDDPAIPEGFRQSCLVRIRAEGATWRDAPSSRPTASPE